jgi:hypothetical protein
MREGTSKGNAMDQKNVVLVLKIAANPVSEPPNQGGLSFQTKQDGQN